MPAASAVLGFQIKDLPQMDKCLSKLEENMLYISLHRQNRTPSLLVSLLWLLSENLLLLSILKTLVYMLFDVADWGSMDCCAIIYNLLGQNYLEAYNGGVNKPLLVGDRSERIPAIYISSSNLIRVRDVVQYSTCTS